MFFRLFFLFRFFPQKNKFNISNLIIHSIKKLTEFIPPQSLNLLIIKKLWMRRHTFCYIMDDEYFSKNFYYAYGRG